MCSLPLRCLCSAEIPFCRWSVLCPPVFDTSYLYVDRSFIQDGLNCDVLDGFHLSSPFQNCLYFSGIHIWALTLPFPLTLYFCFLSHSLVDFLVCCGSLSRWKGCFLFNFSCFQAAFDVMEVWLNQEKQASHPLRQWHLLHYALKHWIIFLKISVVCIKT